VLVVCLGVPYPGEVSTVDFSRINLAHTSALARPAAKFSESKRADKYHAYNKGSSDEEVISAVEKIATARKIPMVHVALAYVLSRPFITAPIVGVRNTERMDELIEGLKVKLSEEEIKAIEEVYKTQPIKGFAGLTDGVNAEQ
jgi:aryl-alcohol dehydrogenase-like predicted oxidoreductase